MSTDQHRPLRDDSSSENEPDLQAVELKEQTRTWYEKPPIDTKRERYPFCIVWGPLPLITWLIPFIGHMGIGDSEGRVHDFAGPYFIGVDDFMTPIAKYYQVPFEDIEVTDSEGRECTSPAAKQIMWDRAIQQSDSEYVQTMHNIVTNNCHHHTARALRVFGIKNMSLLKAWWLIQTRGRYVSWCKVISIYLPFTVLAVGIAMIVVFAK